MALDHDTLRLLLADAKAQGLTVEAYERLYGLSLGSAYPAARRWQAETPMSELRWQREAAPVAGSGGAERERG